MSSEEEKQETAKNLEKLWSMREKLPLLLNGEILLSNEPKIVGFMSPSPTKD